MNDVKLMPHSSESEAGIISAILGRGAECLDNLSVQLCADSFWDKKNRVIFNAACELHKLSKPVDTAMILEKLESNGTLEDAGTAVYVFSLSSAFPTDSHIHHYTDQILAKQKLRRLLDIASDVLRKGFEIEEVEDYTKEIEAKFDALSENSKDQNLLESSHDEVMDLLEKLKSGEGIGAIETGVSAIDESIMGVVPGMMDVYAAEAGCGKTSLVEMIALEFLKQEKPILIFQRDMTPSGFYFRLACRSAGVTVSDIRRFPERMKNEIEQVQRCALNLRKTPLKLYSPDGCTGADVRTLAKREARKSGIKVVIVDHIRTLRHSKATSWDGIEENSGYIRQSTNETSIPHIVLAHINRTGVQSDRPTISHIKGGDQLKDDSDNCCVMWAPEGKPDLGTGDHTWKVNFAFDKCRWDGASLQTMKYNGPKMRFETIRI